MSRTYRNHTACAGFGHWWIGLKESRHNKDSKPGCKPAGWYKRMKSRLRRAREKQAFREGREPVMQKNDYMWYWN